MNKLKETLSSYWLTIQGNLFPWLKEEVGELTEKQMLLITVLETIRIEEYIPKNYGMTGRPQSDRAAIARAFIAKTVYNLSTTRMLLDRLDCDIALRRICGWEKKNDIPDESTFSRAFAELAARQLLEQIHESLIKDSYEGEIVGHLSRDATKIEAREKPVKKVKEDKPPRKRGRPKKGEEVIKEPTRLERQSQMNVKEMFSRRKFQRNFRLEMTCQMNVILVVKRIVKDIQKLGLDINYILTQSMVNYRFHAY
jgi:transposase